jgi:uncharacterized protein
MEFEWDPEKAESNFRKHGISFDVAQFAFDDDNSIEWADEYPYEERSVLLGRANGIILYVVYTEREDRIRLISARRADKHEQDTYYHANSSGRTPH